MGHYLVNFAVYTMAMVGLILFALFIFKTCTCNGFSRKSSMLNVIDSMKLSPRKTLYVIKVENEKYLIAADTDNTSLIAKLDDDAQKVPPNLTFGSAKREDNSLKLKSFDGIKSMDEFSTVVDFSSKSKKTPVMKKLALKLKQN